MPDRSGVAPSGLTARIALTPEDVAGALGLRASVFVDEIGALRDRNEASTAQPLERDRYDEYATHLIVEAAGPHGTRIVGTSRLINSEQAARAGGFYSAHEFDLGPILTSGHRLLEVGRTCIHRDYRGGVAMVVLWQALAEVAAASGATVVFGTASFPGTEPLRHVAAIDILHRDHLAPDGLRVRSRHGGWVGGWAEAKVGAKVGGNVSGKVGAGPQTRAGSGRLEAMKATPALIKSYLRLGGVIGDGVFVDTAFNTTDVCMILQASALKGAASRLYLRPTGCITASGALTR